MKGYSARPQDRSQKRLHRVTNRQQEVWERSKNGFAALVTRRDQPSPLGKEVVCVQPKDQTDRPIREATELADEELKEVTGGIMKPTICPTCGTTQVLKDGKWWCSKCQR